MKRDETPLDLYWICVLYFNHKIIYIRIFFLNGRPELWGNHSGMYLTYDKKTFIYKGHSIYVKRWIMFAKESLPAWSTHEIGQFRFETVVVVGRWESISRRERERSKDFSWWWCYSQSGSCSHFICIPFYHSSSIPSSSSSSLFISFSQGGHRFSLSLSPLFVRLPFISSAFVCVSCFIFQTTWCVPVSWVSPFSAGEWPSLEQSCGRDRFLLYMTRSAPQVSP